MAGKPLQMPRSHTAGDAFAMTAEQPQICSFAYDADALHAGETPVGTWRGILRASATTALPLT